MIKKYFKIRISEKKMKKSLTVYVETSQFKIPPDQTK